MLRTTFLLIVIMIGIDATSDRTSLIGRFMSIFGLDREGKESLGLSLLNAIGDDDSDRVAELLMMDVNVNDIFGGDTPVMRALLFKRPQILDILITFGAKIDVVYGGDSNRKFNGFTPLTWAIALGHNESAELLIARGANVNLPDKNGWSPIIHAAKTGNLTLLKQLCDKTAQPNHTGEDGATALTVAITYGHINFASESITRGADMNLIGAEGSPPLVLAIQGGHFDFARELVTNGVKLDIGFNPLTLALEAQQLELAYDMIKRGVDVRVTTRDGTTPLIASIEGNLGEMALDLIHQRASINQPSHDGIKPLTLALRNGLSEIAVELIYYGADISDDSALTEACKMGYEDIVNMMILNGNPDVESCRPLIESIRNGHVEIARTLLAFGFNVNCSLPDVGSLTDRWTPLMFAIQYGDLDFVRELVIERGANVNSEARFGDTPLIVATKLNRIDIVMFLVEQKAAITARAIEIADSPNRIDIYKFFEEHRD